MKKNHIVIKCTTVILIAIFAGVVSFAQESYYKQEAYILSIGEDRVSDTTQIRLRYRPTRRNGFNNLY